MGTSSYVRSVVDRNVVMRRMTVFLTGICIQPEDEFYSRNMSLWSIANKVVYRLNLYSFYLRIIQQTLRPSPHMQPPGTPYKHSPIRTNPGTYTVPLLLSSQLLQFLPHTQIQYMYGFKCTDSKQSESSDGHRSVHNCGYWKRDLFQSLQSGAFECRGGTKVFGKSAYPVLACIHTQRGTPSSHFFTLQYSAFLCK